MGSVASLVDRENLVRKIHFPRMVVPLSVVLTAYFNFLLNLLVVIVFALASGVEPRISWLELPLLLVFLGLFVIGIAMLLSSLYVRFRDVQPIWDVVAQALFYASPVIYVIEKIPQPAWKHIVMCNPVATVLTFGGRLATNLQTGARAGSYYKTFWAVRDAPVRPTLTLVATRLGTNDPQVTFTGRPSTPDDSATTRSYTVDARWRSAATRPSAA